MTSGNSLINLHRKAARKPDPGTCLARPSQTGVNDEYPSAGTRWIQLGLGLIVMMTISSPQYVWTLFVKPFQATTGSGLPAVQVTFTLLIVLQTFFSPAQGWLIERFSAKGMIALGAALSGLGWAAASHIDSLYGLYATYGVLCGLGTGIVYVGIIGLMVRWFPERRGLAAGVVAAGYGMGAIATTFPISDMIAASGYRHTLLVFGVILGTIGFIAALGLRPPQPGETPRFRPTRSPAPPATCLRRRCSRRLCSG